MKTLRLAAAFLMLAAAAIGLTGCTAEEMSNNAMTAFYGINAAMSRDHCGVIHSGISLVNSNFLGDNPYVGWGNDILKLGCHVGYGNYPAAAGDAIDMGIKAGEQIDLDQLKSTFSIGDPDAAPK